MDFKRTFKSIYLQTIFILSGIKLNLKLIKRSMVSILQEINVTHVFNHFAQKKCINHQKRKVSSVCLHEDCWKLESDKAFFCEDCNVNHVMKHRNSMRFNALFTDELFEECDEYINITYTNDKLTERKIKFDQKISELYIEIEQSTKYQFSELKKFFENYLIEKLHIDYFQAIDNLKQILVGAQKELCSNYKLKEKVKSYCIQIQNIQNDCNHIMYEQVIDEKEKKYDKMEEEFDSKLQQMGNEIKESVKNQVNQLANYLIDCNKKNKLVKSESLMKEEPNNKALEIKKVKDTTIFVPEIPMVKILKRLL